MTSKKEKNKIKAGRRYIDSGWGLLKRSTYLLARVLIGLVAIALIVYVTLDTIYFHVFFTTESAVVGVVYTLIVTVAMFLLLIVQQREKGDVVLRNPSESAQ